MYKAEVDHYAFMKRFTEPVKTLESLITEFICTFGGPTSETAVAAPVGSFWTALQAPPRPPAARQTIIFADNSSPGETIPKPHQALPRTEPHSAPRPDNIKPGVRERL